MGERKVEIFANSNVTYCLYGNANPFYTRNYLLGSTSSSFTDVDSHACMDH
jgi:hypothetical protein